MIPHQLAEIIRRAHAIGERKENQIGIENYPREWQEMIVAALEAFGDAQRRQVTPGWIDAAALQAAREIAAITWTYTSKVPAIQVIVAREMMRAASQVPSTQEKPLSFCSRCGGKDPDCYICGTVVALQTIARFPITDPKNMDAMNMRLIAKGALASSPTEGK
jgi:hypothetical protein